MSPAGISVFGVEGLMEIRHGDPLARLIVDAIHHYGGELRDGDVLVVTQKIISKAEGRVVEIDRDDPDAKRRLAESEAVRVLRRRGDLVITETRHGFICANSGVDLSNVAEGYAVLLPLDPDRSARGLRDAIAHLVKVDIGVIISDTFGRAWRRGVTDVAIGISGIAAVVDLRSTRDHLGRELVATEVCVADEICSAADLVMGKANRVPVAVVRGVNREWFRESSVRAEIVRPPGEDLFR
ncbi:MAG TPA: coenzyme F420-0:L-glutamate ligase [Acidimicrobiales bacterium]|nr:coenzyme F420-0:L-glutamate ligase [Acidimicrobiales bacterium]